jgi:hypothetical protein
VRHTEVIGKLDLGAGTPSGSPAGQADRVPNAGWSSIRRDSL